jgi:hypothetical protein
VHENARLTAEWTRNDPSSQNLGTLQIFSENDYTKIKTIHNEAAQKLKRPDLNWDESFAKSKSIIRHVNQQ